MKTIQIAIDGPASSGKSTVAKIVAKDFGPDRPSKALRFHRLIHRLQRHIRLLLPSQEAELPQTDKKEEVLPLR